MEPSAILEALLEVAREAGLEVRAVERGEPDLPQPGSGVVMLKGRVFVMLSSVDSPSTWLPLLMAARPCAKNESPCTCCDIPRRCDFSKLASIPR